MPVKSFSLQINEKVEIMRKPLIYLVIIILIDSFQSWIFGIQQKIAYKKTRSATSKCLKEAGKEDI